MQFSKGEKVEATWKSDGQRYPGTILNVYPNDNYEVLFDDGVKSRKKTHQIFKLDSGSTTTTETVTTNGPSTIPPAAAAKTIISNSSVTASNKSLPVLISAKASVIARQQSSSSTASIPPPPPLYCGGSNSKSSRRSENNSSSDSPSSSRPSSPCTVTISSSEEVTKSTTNSFKDTNSSASVGELNSASTNANGSSSPSPSPNNAGIDPNNANTSINSTKKGFVYVQQPHYSVFDPPPVDLGKRQRRVHNYSMLAKGPPLKKGLSLNGSDEFDENSSSPTVSRSSSPSIINTPCSIPAGNKLFSSTFTPSTEASQTPTTSTVPVFTRRRRFLTSPTKSKSATTTSNTTNNNINKTTNETNSSINGDKGDNIVLPKPSVIPTHIHTTNSSTKETEKKIEKTVNTPSKVVVAEKNDESIKSLNTLPTATPSGEKIVKSNHVANSRSIKNKPEILPVPTPAVLPMSLPSPLNEQAEDVPSKRLRKPSFKRFSAEEGYVDIFSRRSRRSRTDTSPQSPRGRSSWKAQAADAISSDIMTQTTLPKSPSKDPSLPAAVEVKSRGRKSKSTSPVKRVSERTIKPVQNDLFVDPGGISDEDELLDVGEYTTIAPTPSTTKKTSPVRSQQPSNKTPLPLPALKRMNSKTSINSTKDPGTELPPLKRSKSIPESHSATAEENAVLAEAPVVENALLPEETKGLVQKRPLRHSGRTSRRWQAQPSVKKPQVVLESITIPEVQILVEKCDSALQGTRLTGTTTPKSKTEIAEDDQEVMLIESSTAKSTSTHHRKKNNWGDSKKRWQKSKKRGLLSGIRPKRNANDSLSMQLLKRSRFQRRFDKRGRPKLALLTGITKKKLKKIQESVKRRKLRKKKIVASTKFKDVRVDIINCICGRTDEFGLMVQCEVCLCWQHGNCFDITDGSNLPRFYVCQSCASPKSVRPSHSTEGIRQEMYKKGVLPSFPSAPKPSARKERIIKRCNDLNKALNSIHDAIRQNRIKELIATTEPDHRKLFQWSTPRAHPKDLIQKFQFNKYFKSVLRRLLKRHKTKPDYIQKLSGIVAFRDKLKKYSLAFEEAKLAISRKIGPRGLILIEKLSDQQTKLSRIQQAREKLELNLEGVSGFAKMKSSSSSKESSNCDTYTNSKSMQTVNSPLCKSCLESLDKKWTWDQMNGAKSIKTALEDSIPLLLNEFQRLHSDNNVNLSILKDPSVRNATNQNQPLRLTELCRETLSKQREPKLKTVTFQQDKQQDKEKINPPSATSTPNSNSVVRSCPPTSAEEESILSLLSLSKTPVQFNGENVSELSIESLRKLTDRLQHNGPLCEDLAKVVGKPLTNGKIGLKQSSNRISSETRLSMDSNCVRCELKDEAFQKITILVTSNSQLIESLDPEEFDNFYQSLTNLPTAEIPLQGAALKRSILKKIEKFIKLLETKKMDPKITKEAKATPEIVKKWQRLIKPEEYLIRMKSEYVEALMPYATYFISRFTKRDQVIQAKKTWVNEMLEHYIKTKRSLKEMYGVVNDDMQLQEEHKFYTALDNLRKSFDIVLTKKDIKMRRQNQSDGGADGKIDKEKRLSSISVPPALPPPPVASSSETSVNLVNSNGRSNCNGNTTYTNNTYVPPATLQSSKTEADVADEQMQEMEILARLAAYPIQVEDVNALLGIANDSTTTTTGDTNANTNKKSQDLPETKENELHDSSIKSTEDKNPKPDPGQEIDVSPMEDMEVDDLKLLEDNLALKTTETDNLVLDGDLDLMNTIGNLGSGLKGTEDSELLLNVFDDPIFSDPPEEPKPCSSKSMPNNNYNRSQTTMPTVPVLAKLTPEMCKCYLLDDIQAHQQVIDSQLDKLEGEIMDLERRRGSGVLENDDGKLFEMLFTNMQILLENMDVIKDITDYSIGRDNVSVGDATHDENVNSTNEDTDDSATLSADSP